MKKSYFFKRENIYIRDPFIIKYKDKFIMYGTNERIGERSVLKAYESKDLLTFKEHIIFEENNDFWGREQFWAPEVYKLGDTYYLIGTFSKGDNIRRIHILTSKDPLGKFIPQSQGLLNETFSHLDGTLVMDNDKKYIIFSKEWTDKEDHDGEMCIIEVNDELKPIGDYKTLFHASDASWVVKIKEGGYVTDGPFVIRNPKGQFVMIWSSFSKDGYSIGQAISDKVDGPYRHIDTPLISSNGGHGMIIEIDGQMKLVYHYPNSPYLSERATLVDLCWDNGLLKIK